MRSSRETDSSTKQAHTPLSSYREVTPRAIATGVIIGCVLTATITYVGMVLGFTIGGSTVAAILGWGILRVLLRSGTILENNIVQTAASAINTTAAGVIFTIPALFLMGVEFNIWAVTLACIAGAVLGVGFIIPLRRQMIDTERLLFPTGIAVATILRSPGEGAIKARVLVVSALCAALVIVLQNSNAFHFTQKPLIPEMLDLGKPLGLPSYIVNVWAISLFSLGAGFITGRNGLIVLAGGILSYWIITPIVIGFGWEPAAGEFDLASISGEVYSGITRPLGIGMLVGGAIGGLFLTFPAVIASIRGLERARKSRIRRKMKDNPGVDRGSASEEMPVEGLYLSIGLALCALLVAAKSGGLGWGNSVVVSLIGALWLWLAGIIVAQATGMTDWSPISGMALLAIALLLFLTGKQILPAVMVGAAVCVACGECADMMQDLKTGHLVGSRPRMQQFVQLGVVAVGPLIALSVVYLLWQSGGTDPATGRALPGFGEGTSIPAPQATALRTVISGILEGTQDWSRYGAGAVVGGLLSLSGIPGLGVLVGISMYLPLFYILPYGLGAILRMIFQWFGKEPLSEKWGIPVAVGLIVGDALITLSISLLKVAGVVPAG